VFSVFDFALPVSDGLYQGEARREDGAIDRPGDGTEGVEDARPHASLLVHFAHGGFARLLTFFDVTLGQHPLGRIVRGFNEQSPTVRPHRRNTTPRAWPALRASVAVLPRATLLSLAASVMTDQ
jgi:hypothetical protein